MVSQGTGKMTKQEFLTAYKDKLKNDVYVLEKALDEKNYERAKRYIHCNACPLWDKCMQSPLVFDCILECEVEK